MYKKLAPLLCVFILLSALTACGGEMPASETPADNSGVSTNETPALKNTVPPSSPETAKPEEGASDSLFSKISALTLDGESVSGGDIKGEVLTVLNIWATWCPPCVGELPHLQEVSEYYADSGVRIIGVLQDGVDNALEPDQSVIADGKTLLVNAGAGYTVILPDTVIWQEFISTMEYFPTTFFLDSEGNLIKTVIGSKDTEGWKREIDGVLEELSQ